MMRKLAASAYTVLLTVGLVQHCIWPYQSDIASAHALTNSWWRKRG